jgi:RimJ/RimL family protein N-acetyltransferase
VTKQIALLLIDQDLSTDLDRGHEAFEKLHDVHLLTNVMVVREVIHQTLVMMAANPRDAMWGGYLGVDPQTSNIVGTCGFKHGPTLEGAVEIAYFTFPEFEGQGFATAMAIALKELAEHSRTVQKITAHTLPERNPSTRILEKIGMRWVGAIDDPEDGRIWRWECDVGV